MAHGASNCATLETSKRVSPEVSAAGAGAGERLGAGDGAGDGAGAGAGVGADGADDGTPASLAPPLQADNSTATAPRAVSCLIAFMGIPSRGELDGQR